jgi:hypothetical protein
MAASRPFRYSEVCTTTTGAPHDAQTTKVARTTGVLLPRGRSSGEPGVRRDISGGSRQPIARNALKPIRYATLLEGLLPFAAPVTSATIAQQVTLVQATIPRRTGTRALRRQIADPGTRGASTVIERFRSPRAIRTTNV